MTEIDKYNSQDYFEVDTFKELLDVLRINVQNELDFLPPHGAGCMCISDVKVKNMLAHNVYIEYNYEKGSQVNFSVQPERIVIFTGEIPKEISERIALISQSISDFNKLN